MRKEARCRRRLEVRNQRSETVLLRLIKAVSFCVLERSKRQDERFEKFAINYKNKKRTHHRPPKEKLLSVYSSSSMEG